MGVAHENITHKPFMKQYWLGKTKGLQIDLKCFQQVATGFKKIFFHCSMLLWPERCLWHNTVRTIHSSWTYQCPHPSLLAAKSVGLVVAHDGFPS